MDIKKDLDNQVVAVDEGHHEKSPPAEKEVPILIKICVVLSAVFFAAGSHYGDSAVSTIKNEIKHSIQANNTQYGVIISALYLINGSPLVLLGGLLIDKYGCMIGGLTSSLLVLVVGRLIHGFGIGLISISQESLLSKWFAGSGLGLVLGIQIASSRLFGWLGQATSIPINQATGTVTACLWLGVGLSVLGVISTICYMFVVKLAGGEPRDPHATPGHRRSFSPRVILYLPAGFWLIPLNYFLLGSVWETFMANVKPFISTNWNYSSEAAGYISSITRGVPIVLTPLSGLVFDYFGYRGSALIIGNVILAVSFILFSYTHLTPYLPLVLFSINKSIGVVTLISSIPLIVPPENVSLGLSFYRLATAVGEGIFNIVWGIVQDNEHGGYTHAMSMMLGLSITAIAAAVVYLIFDIYCNHSLLNASNKKRAVIKEKHAGDMPIDRVPPMTERPTVFSIIAVTLLSAAIVVCWGLFIYVLAAGKEAD
ncbi:MFS general substrate transporter [Conidiobolus coronatus NRRL 28638]|uniref:Lysosomal dipeptide transporter MFSD1 n=1 Tax=Conidiobolus coronatus (strain ATCC 28846 / CBS 209.66 / NRRL 28638) TaxID=796925 RepID=A0A137PJ85_CONC2|nr:MFS general substrate transporter [Conidiobolus coronatus NRRL 28638]|eukprot:KXN75064.1 MFS general substrate transporter [Conidiobolus coronatus NRRL 28638]